MCVKYMQLPWNIPMVAALNETTETIVKEGLRENHSLVHQLKNPYARNTKRDLNKRIHRCSSTIIFRIGKTMYIFTLYTKYVKLREELMNKYK